MDRSRTSSQDRDVPPPRGDEGRISPSLDKEKSPGPEDQPDAPPDGGLTAWLVVVGAWCTSFCSFGWVNSVGIFQNYYESHLLKHLSSSTISWIPSLQIFFMFAMGPIVGKLYDTFGARYLIIGGTFFHVFGLMMASISTQYYQLLLSQGICSAIGAAAIFQPALSAVSAWFNRKRGIAFATLSTGSSVGGVIFPIMVDRLIAKVGFGWSMRISAFMILFLLGIAIVTVKARRPPPQGPKPSGVQLLQPFKEPVFIVTLLGYMLLTYGVFIPINYVIVQAVASGMNADLASYLVPMLNGASLFGRLGAGFMSDRYGRYNIFIVMCIVAGVLVLALWIPATSNAPIIVFATLFGFASGAYVSLSPALIAQISPLKEVGYRTGLLFLFASVGGLTTSPIAGAILQNAGGDYTHMKIFSGVMLLGGTAFIITARIVGTGLKLVVKY
ncbi:monocarboxylate transporter [Aspergillus flavus AF70]|nr:monocarboxylate transporter [Aspergillus flavus AF70]